MSTAELVDLLNKTFLIGVEIILVAFIGIIMAGVIYGCVTNVKMGIDTLTKKSKKNETEDDIREETS